MVGKLYSRLGMPHRFLRQRAAVVPSSGANSIVLFPNSLLEEVENLEENSEERTTLAISNRNNSSYVDEKPEEEYDESYPMYGRDSSTVKSPPLASSVYYGGENAENAVSAPSVVGLSTKLWTFAPKPQPTLTLDLDGDYTDFLPVGGGFEDILSTLPPRTLTSLTTTTTTLAMTTTPVFSTVQLDPNVLYINHPGFDNATTPAMTFDQQTVNWQMIEQQFDATTTGAIALAIFLLIFPIVTVFGNLLVVLSVYTERSLRSSTNYYIVSLAFADILVGALVMPLAVYVELVSGVWRLGTLVCDLWIACDVLACTASILNLVAISVDRLLAVTKPVLYARNKSFVRVWVSIAAAWLTSVIIASPIILGANDIPSRQALVCTFYNAEFIIVSSFGSFYIPSIAIVAPYYVIFRTLQRRAQKFHRQRYGGASSVVIERKASQGGSLTQHPSVDGERRSGSILASTARTLAVMINRQAGVSSSSSGGRKMASNTQKRSSIAQISKMGTEIPSQQLSSGSAPRGSLLPKPKCADDDDPFGGIYVGPATPIKVTTVENKQAEVTPEKEDVEDPPNERLLHRLGSTGAYKKTVELPSRDRTTSLTDRNRRISEPLVPLSFLNSNESVMEGSSFVEQFTSGAGTTTGSNEGSGCYLTPKTGRSLKHAKKHVKMADHRRKTIDSGEPTASSALLHQELIQQQGFKLKNKPVFEYFMRKHRQSETEEAVAGAANAVQVDEELTSPKSKDGLLTDTPRESSGHLYQKNQHINDPPSYHATTSVVANRHVGAATAAQSSTKSTTTTTSTLSTKFSGTTRLRRAAMTKERRATVMTVIVLALFFICWVPFFTANTVNAACIRFGSGQQSGGGQRCVSGTLMSVFVWLGYINSLMNPVVYAVFNPEYRKAFKKLLHLY